MAGGRVCGGSALYLAAGYDYSTGTKEPPVIQSVVTYNGEVVLYNDEEVTHA